MYLDKKTAKYGTETGFILEESDSNRWEFIGSISEEMGKKYRYKSVEHYWKKSSEHPHSNPFTYTFDNK